jgi:hypothetical protein
MKLKYQDITEDIIGAAYEVYNTLGYGFLEKVYQRAMQVELIRRGHKAEMEVGMLINFGKQEVEFKRFVF